MHNWQLFAAGFWGILALALALRTVLFSPETLAQLPIRNWTMAIALGTFLFVWNLARWYQSRARRLERRAASQPLQRDQEAKAGYEYNPEFDFQKMDRDDREVPRRD